MWMSRSVPVVAKRWSVVMLVAVAAVGMACAGGGCAPSQKDVAEANFGPRPDRCERIIQQEMDLTVFSGQQGEYVFKEPPYKAAVIRKFLGGQEFGWIVEFEAKGPTAFGTGGFRTYHYFVPNDGTMVMLTNDAIIHRVEEK